MEKTEVQYNIIRELVNSLQRTCYQLRFLEYQKNDLKFEWAITEKDKGMLAENISIGIGYTNNQLYDTALLNKQSMLTMINRLLKNNNTTRDFTLNSDADDTYRIIISGGVENKAGVDYIGCGSFEELEETAVKQRRKHLFLSSRDFGEINVDKKELLDGEFYAYSGDPVLSSIFWPFLINLDGTCYSINDPNSLVLDLEISEK